MKTVKCSRQISSIGKNLALLVFCFFAFSVPLLAAPGRLDLNFPQIMNSDANITAMEIQTDSKILIAGTFTTRGAISHKDMVRINPDGTVDETFSVGTGVNTGQILALKLQPDGKILIGGTFNTINSVGRSAIARLNSDGSVDTNFGVSGLDITFTFDIDLLPDGKIIAGATNLIGLSFIARLTTTGANDTGFGQPFFSNGGFGYQITYLSAENKILVSYSMSTTYFLIKINPSGGVEPNFSCSITGNPSSVDHRTLNATGKYLVFGKFTTVNGSMRNNIAVVNSDGTLDTSFVPATTGTETILSAVAQSNGKIAIGGRDFSANNAVSGNIARLNANGTADMTFHQGKGTPGDVKVMAIPSSNKLLVGGNFFRFQGLPRTGLLRVGL